MYMYIDTCIYMNYILYIIFIYIIWLQIIFYIHASLKTHKNRVDVHQSKRKCCYFWWGTRLTDGRKLRNYPLIKFIHSFIHSVSQSITSNCTPAPTMPGTVLSVIPELTICHTLEDFRHSSVNSRHHPYVVGTIIVLICKWRICSESQGIKQNPNQGI